jgi:hypothetical protein
LHTTRITRSTTRQNRLGFLYNRRTAAEGTNQDRIRQAYEAALDGARKLEQELGGSIRFDETNVEIWVNDRMLAPNYPDVATMFESEVAKFWESRFGNAPTFERSSDPRELVRVRVLAGVN